MSDSTPISASRSANSVDEVLHHAPAPAGLIITAGAALAVSVSVAIAAIGMAVGGLL